MNENGWEAGDSVHARSTAITSKLVTYAETHPVVEDTNQKLSLLANIRVSSSSRTELGFLEQT